MEQIVFKLKEEAELVLDHLVTLLNSYEFVSVNDFHDLVGLPSVYSDSKTGWITFDNIEIKSIDEHFFIDLPDPVPIGGPT